MKHNLQNLLLMLCLFILLVLMMPSCGDSESDGSSDDDDDSVSADGDNWADDDDDNYWNDDDDDAYWDDDDDDDDDDMTDDDDDNDVVVDKYKENGFVSTDESPFSTFSIDVDTASYSYIRDSLMNYNQLPDSSSVRIEEMINYFDYDYPEPANEHPVTMTTNIATCPWQEGHLLMRVGLKAKHMAEEDRPLSNLVFLIDVSGSMGGENKLSLAKQAFSQLVESLGDTERVSIVTYEGGVNVVLDSTPCSDKDTILSALAGLESGGGTNGSGGMQKAYDIALEHFISGGNNRVILATDGDFNIGTTDTEGLIDIASSGASDGVFLTILGFGHYMNDSMMEDLSNQVNGNYGFIDSLAEAEKVFAETMYTVAKDVKIQIEFNPDAVAAYRLIGYDNRMLNYDDFNDDTVDAGDIGPDHTVTALYQLVPVGTDVGYDLEQGEDTSAQSSDFDNAQTVAKLAFRYKPVEDNQSKLLEQTAEMVNQSMDDADPDFRFATGVTAFGMILRKSAYTGSADFDTAKALAESAADNDSERLELLQLINQAQSLWPSSSDR